jgi:DNA repair ATPase RecN
MIKKKIEENGVLNDKIRALMTPAAIKELGALNPTMQQFLLRFVDLSLTEHDEEHDKILSEQIKEELKDFLFDIHEADNECICKNIAEIVAAQNKNMFAALSEQTRLIGEIASDIGDIKRDIKNIKDRLKAVEENVLVDEERINDIEQKLKTLDPDLVSKLIDEIEEIRPKIARILKYSSVGSTTLRVVGSMIIGWAITFALLHYVFHIF